MKKLFLVAAVTLGVAFAASLAEARMRVSTSAFNANHTTATVGTGQIEFVHFSTGSINDFVDVIDSSTTLNSVGAPTYRFYNDNVVSTATISTLGSGRSNGATPIPFYRGLIYKPSSSNYNSIVVGFDDDKR